MSPNAFLEDVVRTTTFGYCICLVMIGLVLLGMVNAVRLRLYLRNPLLLDLLRCNVGSVWYTCKTWKFGIHARHGTENNAQCSSSSRVITFEGWDGAHHGFFNSKRSCVKCDDYPYLFL